MNQLICSGTTPLSRRIIRVRIATCPTLGLACCLVLVTAYSGTGADCVKWVKRTDVGSYGQRMHHAMAYDSDRGVTVFFGGEIGQGDDRAYFDDTQEYNGTNWLQVNIIGPKPPTRSMHAMAYDPVRKQVVLCGGHRADGYAFSDTWLYTNDGRGNGFWTNVPASAETRAGHAMVWNPVRQVVTMQGGIERVFPPGIALLLSTTREWNGESWGVNNSGQAPHAYGLAMAFDSSRNVALAYGGFSLPNENMASVTDYFWEYVAGAVWNPPRSGPSRRAYAAMAYHERRQRIMMVGGVGDSPAVGEEAYEYIPERGFWFNLPPLPPGQGRAGAKMVYDSKRGVMVLTGGAGGGAPNASEGGRYSDTWELRPGLEILTQPAHTTNDVCTVASFSVQADGVEPLHYDWRLDGKRLSNDAHFSGVDSAVLTIHALRHGHAGKYDVIVKDSCGAQNVAAQNVVTSRVATLTVQPASEWVFRTTNGPPVRFAHGMVYDSARRVTVLFGGRTSWGFINPFNDLWEWDGALWTRRIENSISNGWMYVPAIGWRATYKDYPVRRAHFAMAYDSGRKVVVMFGGLGVDPSNSGVNLRDLWEWDGTEWRLRSTNGPIARFHCSMAYDERRARTVLFGGQPVAAVGSNEAPDGELVWEWDGHRWHTNLPPINPSAINYRAHSRMTYDSFRWETVFGPTTESHSHWSFWDWDGGRWTNFLVFHSADPIVTVLHGTSQGGFAFDANRRRSVWFGGMQVTPQNRTAFFDGTQWTLLTNNSTPPAARLLPAMAYDSDRRVMVLFGGSLTSSGLEGATNDTWELAAVDVPVINAHPSSQYRQAGDTAVFILQAVDLPGVTLRYQWYRGQEVLSQDARILGVTSPTLVIQNVSSLDVGEYSVKVSNDCGATLSRPAVLTLDRKLQVISTSNSPTLIWPPDASVVLEVADSPSGPWTVVPNPPNPFNMGSFGPAKFFRLRPLADGP